MNYSDILTQLKSASAFDLYRLRAAIDRTLDEPGWTRAIQARLTVGQTIEYFDTQANTSRTALLIELRRKQALVLDADSGEHWLIPYASINLDGTDIAIRERPRQGLGRNEVSIGDRVGFVDREQRDRSGKVVRLNDKTVTLDCDGQRWRVPYSMLHRVVDAESVTLDGVEILGPAQS